MASRRSSGARRRASSSTSSSGRGNAAATTRTAKNRAERASQADADGKVTIECPNCGSKYKLPEESLGASLTCRNCKRGFVARTAADRRGSGAGRAGKSRGNDTKTYAMIGGGIVVAIIVIIMLANMEGHKVEMAKSGPPPKTIETGWATERVQAAATWVKAVASKEEFQLDLRSDWSALQKQLGVEGTDIGIAPTDEKPAIKAKLIAALCDSEVTKIFQDCEPRGGNLDSEADATGSTGTAHLELYPYPDKAKLFSDATYAAKADVHFRVDGEGVVRVTGFEITRDPPRKKKKRRGIKMHETIAKPKSREVVFGGKKQVIEESELSPLGHLDDTPEPMRKEIDTLIATAMDTEKSGLLVNRARRRLTEIAKPAIPRLLNQMYEVKPKTRDEVLALTGVVAVLRDITGVAFGFSPVMEGASGIGGSEEERVSSLKQWYAWWYRNAHRKDFRTIDDAEDESLLEVTDEEPKAKKAGGSGSRVMK